MTDVSFDWMQGLLGDQEGEGDKKFYGVAVGMVINPVDPFMLGRVQVQLPFIDSLDLSPWARVAVPMAGVAHGSYFIPNIGDHVLVAFEHGDVNNPYIIGSVWTTFSPPPLPSPLPQIRITGTLAQNKIMFSEIPPTITIMTPSGQAVQLSPAGVTILATPSLQIIAGDNVITADPSGIHLTAAKTLTLSAQSVNITGTDVSINGASVKVGGGMVMLG